MRAMGEAFNIKIMATSAESPWSNALPNVYVNDPPALEPTTSSEIVRDNLNALHLARQEFIKVESGERFARALRHNIRSSDFNDIQNGDEVFYKRNDSHEWHGPGVVIGRDGKQILVRHGGVYVRVHVCRLACAPEINPAVGGGISSEEKDDVVKEKPNDDCTPVLDEYPPDDESENGEVPVDQPPRVSVGHRIQGIHSESGELVSGRISNNVYEEVDDVGQNALTVRWVVTEKLRNGQSIVKARLVARGFEEKTEDLRKDSPTCSKEAVRLALSFASTNQWDCHTMDVKSAYLQGNDIERVVHLRPPPEYVNGKLWKLKKTVYGLCDAARHWYLRVKDQLLSLGAKVSSLDSALFYWCNSGKVEGIVCVYVDDFLWAGTQEFKQQVINRLSQIFIVGSSETKAFKYVGLNVISNNDGSITLDQFQYASSLKPVTLSRNCAAVKSGELSGSEKSEYRSLIGQFSWIATHTRPDIAFDVCELSVTSTIAELLRLSKVIDRVKTDNMKLYIPRMMPLNDCYMECFSDASFANLVGNGSQGGFVIFLRDASEARCPIFWQTRKIRRVVKSTLSAEALALLECVETAVYLASILSELSGSGKFKIKCFVDNKSLVDALYSSRSVEDRRLRIDIAVLQDMLERGEIDGVSWVDTSQQLADCLTKKGASTERLRAAVSRD
ncbi:hypothetical protein Pcinc_021147 [Petrolisthes cinctipes]|uniref:Reverse transcriptase Ty1/copia-type domain-containing protein n=3 Tax=Petrolisthes cinctipes TaxID=88211 RepID=A0AAE1FGI2_PETCI|nr:hypothetical protein Pcinc_021147 [Petrolisthes cinctipes]